MPRQVSIREKFPPPWRVRDPLGAYCETPGGYGVEDSTGRNLLHVYGDEGLLRSIKALRGLRRSVMGLLTRAEARSIAMAMAIARLPSLMERAGKG